MITHGGRIWTENNNTDYDGKELPLRSCCSEIKIKNWLSAAKPIIVSNHSGVRRIDTSISSKNNSTLTTEKRRILVVDDDPDIANLYKLSLESDGFIVSSFNDPLLALSNYKAGAYDLLLLDIKMRHMNGLELYQKIRLADKDARVCFISVFEEYHTEFKQSFPNLKEKDCFIRKPIELESLTKKVKSLLRDM